MEGCKNNCISRGSTRKVEPVGDMYEERDCKEQAYSIQVQNLPGSHGGWVWGGSLELSGKTEATVHWQNLFFWGASVLPLRLFHWFIQIV